MKKQCPECKSKDIWPHVLGHWFCAACGADFKNK